MTVEGETCVIASVEARALAASGLIEACCGAGECSDDSNVSLDPLPLSSIAR